MHIKAVNHLQYAEYTLLYIAVRNVSAPVTVLMNLNGGITFNSLQLNSDKSEAVLIGICKQAATRISH